MFTCHFKVHFINVNIRSSIYSIWATFLAQFNNTLKHKFARFNKTCKHRFDRVHISVRLSKSQTNLFRNRSSSFQCGSTAIGVCDCKHCERAVYDQDTCQPHSLWILSYCGLNEHSSNAAKATKEDGVFRKAYRDDAIIAICRPEK